jgi:hypothetical protein
VALRLLSLEPHPKAPRTFAECVLATLKDIAHLFANIRVFQATSDIGNLEVDLRSGASLRRR